MRYYNKVFNAYQLEELAKSPFIQVGDVVELDSKFYVFSNTNKFDLLSVNDNYSTCSFAHKYNIGDKIKLICVDSTEKEVEIINIVYSVAEERAYYVVNDNNSLAQIDVLVGDAQDKTNTTYQELTPLSLALYIGNSITS